ncbi:nicotinamide riboside transporter PnuC [Agromyces seonyuensis]|uniref:Nicotinamide riboside transporter PnuC n=1 Tax=Agromyces seonyuensis TaxID=2662446 RepID=A0A6I4P2L6_9MICO|nr:nicotinamide riboside transporter PnuC [Agromyces seonyuensis]
MIEWLAAHWTEVLGFATGAACVALAGLRNVWNYPVGIANNLVFLVLFAGTGLYASAGLQVVYLALAVHGWVRWTRGVEQDAGYIGRTPARLVPLLIAAGLGLAGVLWWVLATFAGSPLAPVDAATTAASLVAQYLLNRKLLENWYVWIGVDIVFATLMFATLMFATGLWITGILYLGFIVLCIASLRSWRAVERAGTTPASAATAEPAHA